MSHGRFVLGGLLISCLASGCLKSTSRTGDDSAGESVPDAASEPGPAQDGPLPIPNPARDPGVAVPVEVPGLEGERNCEGLADGEQLAFPGAEGFGRLSRGGRGGSVYHVTSLADGGPGTLRDAVSQPNRTIVFDVAGWVTLIDDLVIVNNQLTLAGQTAPGGGIGVRGMKVLITGDDIVVRFLRIRKGNVTSAIDRDDAMGIASSARNVIVDHVSVGFGTDENFSMPGDEPIGPQNVTVQWSIVGYALQRNNHSAGSLLTASGLSIHHTLWAFNKTRNPRARSADGAVLDWVNNVIYGWNAPDPVGEMLGWDISSHGFIMGGTPNGVHRANAVGNYFVARLAAESAFVNGVVDAAGKPAYEMFFFGNLLDGNANGVLDVSKSDEAMIDSAVTLLEEPLPAPRLCGDEASLAYQRVLERAGATLPERDEVDELLVQSVREQSGILIQNESDLAVGEDGYGLLAEGSAPADADGDGMPDAWEEERGLDADEAADGNGDDDGDGFTNLEEYLNELASETI